MCSTQPNNVSWKLLFPISLVCPHPTSNQDGMDFQHFSNCHCPLSWIPDNGNGDSFWNSVNHRFFMVKTLVCKTMQIHSILTHMAAQEDTLYTACESCTSYTGCPKIPANNSGACWKLESAKAPMNEYTDMGWLAHHLQLLSVHSPKIDADGWRALVCRDSQRVSQPWALWKLKIPFLVKLVSVYPKQNEAVSWNRCVFAYIRICMGSFHLIFNFLTHSFFSELFLRDCVRNMLLSHVSECVLLLLSLFNYML
jgi:hypothetical protein